MEESEEKRVMNDLTGLSSGFNSMSLKCSYEFIMMELIEKCSIKQCEDSVKRTRHK